MMRLMRLIHIPFVAYNHFIDRIFAPFYLTHIVGLDNVDTMTISGMPRVVCTPGSTFNVGKGVTILSRPISRVEPGLVSFVATMSRHAHLEIGDNVGINSSKIWCMHHIDIGARSMIGADSVLLDSDIHPLQASQRSQKESRNRGASASIIIEEDVFIGIRVFVTKGSVIGRGSVVGAGAVVSGEFPPYSLIAGNPAKVVRTLEQD
ncbi:MAG: acyltransferase [Chloroflexi bacterium]|nr:acyltransferase [Chloroflexota bacterium]